MSTGFAFFAERDPAAAAIIDPNGRVWSRGEVRALANRTARAFRSSGLCPGDAVAVSAPNCAEHVAVVLAGIDAGLHVVPINWHLAPSEIAFLLQDSGAKVIVAHEALGPNRLETLRDRRAQAEVLVAIGEADRFEPLAAFTAAEQVDPLPPGPLGRTMCYTSATTGRPKGVLLPLENALSVRERFIRLNMSLGVELEAGNAHLCSSMLYHSACLEGALLAMHMGHRLVLLERWEPEIALRAIDQHRVTGTYMVPTMFVRLLKLPEHVRSRYDVSSLKFVIHGGASCPPEAKRRMIEWWGPVLWESYGASEGQGTIVSSEEWLRHPGTVGRPMPGSDIKILNEQGEELPAGETGLIYMTRYTGDRFEYKGDPDKTRASYRGEHFTVGDVGYMNQQGYLFICDRRVDMIISGGVNIYPSQIELALIQHESVADCAVVGEPHELFGALPTAFVQVAPGVQESSALSLELLRYLCSRLGAAKAPKRIKYVAAIPRDRSGKLYRRALRGERPSTDGNTQKAGLAADDRLWAGVDHPDTR
jgi:long-chain acyl-CoA synthetase